MDPCFPSIPTHALTSCCIFADFWNLPWREGGFWTGNIVFVSHRLAALPSMILGFSLSLSLSPFLFFLSLPSFFFDTMSHVGCGCNQEWPWASNSAASTPRARFTDRHYVTLGQMLLSYYWTSCLLGKHFVNFVPSLRFLFSFSYCVS